MNSGFLYILYNELYKSYGPNVYKVGRSVNLKNRMNSYTTPFIDPSKYLYVSRKFDDSVKAERVLFYLLKVYRIRDQREFFDLALDSIITTIKRLENLKDHTINRLYSCIVNNICSSRMITNLESDEDYYDTIIKDLSNVDEYLNQFRFKPRNPEQYKPYGYIPEEEKAFNILLINANYDHLSEEIETLNIS
jgi:hypothetical protein